MKTDLYAQALVAMTKNGMTPKDAVHKLVEYLRAKGMLGVLNELKPHLLKMVEAESGPVVTVAHKADVAHIPEAKGARVIIDESLIGGWRLVNGNTLTDASYKKQLLDIYQGVARS